jgi:peptidoglycan/LPS O-acetylase OafA/YrhL
MQTSQSRAAEIDAALRRVHRGVLATLAVCALVVAATAAGDPAQAPARGFPIAAVGLAVGAVFLRQAASRAPPRAHVRLTLASLLLAGGIGLVAVALALAEGSRSTALLYVLGGAILCLRPPGRIARR